MAENTPNLDLVLVPQTNKESTNFNTETMLNGNWRKLDAFVAAVEDRFNNMNDDDIEQALTEIVQLIGNTDQLETEEKANLVAAINSLHQKYINLDQRVTTHKAEYTQFKEDAESALSQKLNRGTVNTDVNKIISAELRTDTRTSNLFYTDGKLTRVEEKDGAAIVKTTELEYDSNGHLVTVSETALGTNVVTTLVYDANGNLESTSKVVS